MKNTLLVLTMMLAGGTFMSAQTYNSVAEYRAMPEIDIMGTLGRATTVLQQRYDRNVERMSDAIDNISNQISRYDNSNIIADRINRNCIDQLKVNYTNDSNVRSWINWLYRCANDQIK